MKLISHIVFTILFFAFSTASFAQLDTVIYQTSVGSVSSGAMQNTDNFGDEFIPPSNGEYQVIETPQRIIPPDYYGEMPVVDESLNPETIYIEDTGVSDNPSGNGGQTIFLNSFKGYDATNAIPPDPTMAAGPNHIVACVNGFPSFFRIFDKQGNILKTISAAAWWGPVSPDESGDPQVLYDHFADRWVLVWMQVNTGNQTAANLLAYSDDSDPLGVWYVYRLDTKKHGTIQTNTWGDYPQIGFDDEAIYIMTRIFGFSSGFFGSKIRVISKSELYSSNGGSVTWRDFWNIGIPSIPGNPTRPDVIHPTFSYTAGQGGYFFWANGGGWNSYYLYRVLNPLSSAPTIKGKIIVSSYSQAPNAGQLGGGTPLESGGSTCRTAPIVRDGKLYMTHSVRNSVYPTNASNRYTIVDLATYGILEQAELGAQGYYYIYPSIAVDDNENIAVTFSRSADTEYVGAYYSTKHVGDPPGLSPSQSFAEGQGNYNNVASGRNRWGDYMAAYLDPSNNFDVWMHTEYAAGTNTWGTYIAQIRMAPYSGVYTFGSPLNIDFGDTEVGNTSNTFSAIVSNYGDADLTISAVPSSAGDFNLLTNISLPYTIVPYDSLMLEFNFTPSGLGMVSENFNFTSNDPGFNGFDFTGNGYKIYQALDQTFYASSGTENSGNILTVDENSGAGTNIGVSLFDEIKSLSVNPKTGVLFGLVTDNTSSELVRVNAAAGDSYLLHTINIPTLNSMAFDTSGTLYVVTLNGEFHTIDLVTGNTNLVVDAEGSYNAITFHPVLNDLWATTRSIVVNKDLIFKVNLSTGDTTKIGNTGLGKLTNSIAFDDNLDLYGIIGAQSDVADFISIDISSGAGTIVGSVGFKSIFGLAFSESGVTSVEDDGNSSVPSDYALRQNYPNPFNPSTIINFVLPEKSFVDLRVYNILGKEVKTLVLEEKPTGNHEVQFNASNLPSGVYLYKLKAGKFSETKKMILVK
ncbi:MAG: T9SS type A sorting domain-containing protein [Ignavibacteria bacterium]|nr:T9SS type A sorting domain-containing protein [Ignavibacteria bacterium]